MKSKGFTLIELMILIAIVTIVCIMVGSIYYETKNNTFDGVTVGNKDPIGKTFQFGGSSILVTDLNYNSMKYKIVIMTNPPITVEADRMQIQEAYAKSLVQQKLEK